MLQGPSSHEVCPVALLQQHDDDLILDRRPNDNIQIVPTVCICRRHPRGYIGTTNFSKQLLVIEPKIILTTFQIILMYSYVCTVAYVKADYVISM